MNINFSETICEAVTPAELFAAFVGICRAHGEPVMSREDFCDLQEDGGFTRAFASACHIWADSARSAAARQLFTLCERRAYELA